RDGSVPANIAAIAWDPGYDVADDVESAPKLPRLECVAADGSSRELRLAALPEDRPDHLALRDPLAAGERCTLHSGVQDCSVDSNAAHLQDTAEFEVTESSPVPDTLGLIAVAGPTLEDVEVAADASCSESVPACILRTSVVFDRAAEPWRDALLYETLVDGERFSTWRNLSLPDELGGLYTGRDAGAVYVLVGEVPDNVSTLSELAAGEHTLSIRAHLPGSDVVLETPEILVNLDCGRATRTPTATSDIAPESDGCTVAGGLGSSQRRAGLIGLCFAAALLFAGRRRMRP
ncbi:MAG TPA: hypothetical protein VMF89_35555, partial [Polyangiales bacterium]|nr:hypothetical protein [Polyangiales bacterium]